MFVKDIAVMKKYLLDTNICVSILRGNPLQDEAISYIEMAQCYISEITLIELKIGALLGKAKGTHGKYVEQNMDSLLSNVTVLPISPVIDFFAEEKVRLQLMGTPAHNNFDLLIGCTAVANGMVMVTDNIKDFKNIKGINIENWIEH